MFRNALCDLLRLSGSRASFRWGRFQRRSFQFAMLPSEIALHKFFETFRTEAVGKLYFEMDLDIIFDSLPIAFCVSNFFAIAADRQETLELIDMRVQAEDALGDLNTGRQLVRVEGLGHEIIRTGLNRFEIIGLSFEQG